MKQAWPLGIVLVIALMAMLLSNKATTQNVRVEVIDGDTVRYAGQSLRIENIDTPETGHGFAAPECLAERMLGELATLRLAELVEDGAVIHNMTTNDNVRFGLRAVRVWPNNHPSPFSNES